jgi:hypothetical protein
MTDREKTAIQPSLVTLFTEMQALMGLMPATQIPKPAKELDAETASEQRAALEEMIEDGFDNMPV